MRSRIKAFVESNMILPVLKDLGEWADVFTMRLADRLSIPAQLVFLNATYNDEIL